MSTARNQPEKKATVFREQARIAAEAEARLAADPAVQAWLLQFAYDGKNVLREYAEKKASYLVNGPGWLEQEQFRAGWPRQQAYRRLWEIQQKKLFNLQCQWRAGQLELPGVTDGREFKEWGRAIEQCPLLDPVDEDDLALYLRYLASEDCQDLHADALRTTDWQAYESFRHWHLLEEAGSGSPGHDMVRPDLPEGLIDSLGHLFNMFYRYPDWYAFFDLYRGAGPLLRLPQVRFDAPDADDPDADDPDADDPETEAAAPVPATPEPEADQAPDPEPALQYLSAYDLPLTETLLRQFEPPELLHYMRVMEHRPEPDQLTQTAENTYDLLSEISQPVPIAASPDWRVALADAYLAHQRRVVSEALGEVYDEYCLREQTGIAHPAPH
ncbi:hypothetical protein GCM10022409_25410 [Hymenobacter glaciei]|uniref:Uncharacterized protein n=1 Tax=Hymenobacter glaciei TaxID=877209 RepID=A0ABP7U9T0_9BACT